MTTTETRNRKVVLARRPDGMPVDADFGLVDEDVAALRPGQVAVHVDTLSIDAFIRTVMDEGSYHMSVPIGGLITALGVGHVVDSAADGFAPGDHVFGPLGAQTHAIVPAAALRLLDVSTVAPSAYLGTLGLTTGMTAYVGIVEVGEVTGGQTVVVSGAAGAVGSIAGQLARLQGATTVIGIAGGPVKCAYLTDELGFHAAIDYRAEDVTARLHDLAPQGIDVFFDNVGGDILDAALDNIAVGGRVVLCGGISQYGHMDDVRGPRNYLKLAERHARMEGFAVTHFQAELPRVEAALRELVRGGQLVLREHVEHGIDAFPATIQLLLSGGHHGKLLLQVG